MMARISNPFAFTPGPVTLLVTLFYTALIAILLVIHNNVPAAPRNPTPVKGINISEAWQDLRLLTPRYHPYNSRSNDATREWLLRRINQILDNNDVTVQSDSNASKPKYGNDTVTKKAGAYVFSDLVSNLTFSSPGSASSTGGVSVYFEGTNIIVYVLGSEDDESKWWADAKGRPHDKGGVLVNAHYDSVSTGFGATDDGVGVVTLLQLIQYYTTPGQQPRRGLVALFNNGEEDFLNGARAFTQHSIARFPHTFLNLEGAGAGGRATLFRSTDAEVTSAYRNSPSPFGTVVSNDGFQRGLIRSQTDYVVFNEALGLRGLDVAFMEPRARYHTDQDDSRHTSRASLWHMLSASFGTTRALTSDDHYAFEGESLAKGGVDAGHDHHGAWFDILGIVFIVFRLHTLFALSVTLLVVTPVVLLVTLILLYRSDKLYLLSGSATYHFSDGDEEVALYGWRGFFRFPFIFVVSAAAPIALAFLIFKENPYIGHSSEYSVWSMMISAWFFFAWFLSCIGDWARPSALTRVYGYSWLYGIVWALLVADTVFQTHLKLASGYFVLFYQASLFLATWISYLELFSLPKKSKFCREVISKSRRGSVSSSQLLGSSSQEQVVASSAEPEREGPDEQATERTSLLKKGQRATFAHYTRNEAGEESAVEEEESDEKDNYVYGEEQLWSDHLPRWTWIFQLILVVPINVILIGQISLLLVSALHQTGPDGSSMFLLYVAIAAFTILLFSPIIPLIHRFNWQIPIFLLLVLIGTLVYNLLAFPFSDQNRLKVFFQQQVDLESANNSVSLVGVTGYVQEVIGSLPSFAGQSHHCAAVDGPGNQLRCSWSGIPPQIGHNDPKQPQDGHFKGWTHYNVTRDQKANSARFLVSGHNTRACKLVFESPVSNFVVEGSGPNDKRFPIVPDGGSQEIRLWSRTWNRTWVVDVEWEGQGDKEGEIVELSGKVVCLWSDDNQEGVIPALDELRHFAPVWVAVSKAGDGLVEGYKRFNI